MLIKSNKLDFCGKFLSEHKLKLVLAESMTAGYLSSVVSLENHAGDYFLGSVVSYHDDMKRMALQINPLIIQQYGGVSFEVTAEMIAGLTRNFQSDIRIANTGFAYECSETTIENPVGTVYIHLQFGDYELVQRCNFHGDPQKIINDTCLQVIEMLYEVVQLYQNNNLEGHH